MRSARHYDSHIRCVLCDRVNSGEIAEVEQDISHSSFYLINEYGESGLSAYICSDCQSHTDDVRSEWSMIDDLEEEDFDEE